MKLEIETAKLDNDYYVIVEAGIVVGIINSNLSDNRKKEIKLELETHLEHFDKCNNYQEVIEYAHEANLNEIDFSKN